MDDLEVRPGVLIPAADLVERFETSGGPGGQHANRNETKVELSVDLRTCGGLTNSQRQRALASSADAVVKVTVSESRSQWRNRSIARQRLAEALRDLLQPPPPPRRKTRPSRAVRERRIASKKRRGQLKRGRQRPEAE